MNTTIQDPVTKGNVTVRINMIGTDKGVNQKTSQEAKRSRSKNKSNYLSVKQKMAIQSLAEKVEKGGNINLGEILTEAGYSKNTAKTPQKVFGKEIVQKSLKKIGIDPAGIREAHEYLMNSKEIIFHTSTNLIPANKMIRMYKKHLGWSCIAYVEDELNQTRTYEMITRNDKNMIKSLELAYRYLPYTISSHSDIKQGNGTKGKRLIILEELTKKKELYLKEPASLVQ